MSKIVSMWDEKVSFWDVAPAMKISEVAGKMYKSDKSTNKRNSSNKMWIVAFLWDMDSVYYNDPNKVEVVANEFLKGKVKEYNDNYELFTTLKNEYEKLIETPLIKTLKILGEKIVNRTKFLEETDYTIETIKILDDATINTSKIAKTIAEVEEQVGLAQAKSKGKGDSMLSLTDENRI